MPARAPRASVFSRLSDSFSQGQPIPRLASIHINSSCLQTHPTRSFEESCMDWSLEQLRQELAKVTEGMGKERLRWHPEGKWCTAEILEHLYLTYKGTTKGLEHCLGVGKPEARNPTLRERVGAIAVCSFGYLPEGRQSPERARPKGLPYEQVLSLIGPQLEAM